MSNNTRACIWGGLIIRGNIVFTGKWAYNWGGGHISGRKKKGGEGLCKTKKLKEMRLDWNFQTGWGS